MRVSALVRDDDLLLVRVLRDEDCPSQQIWFSQYMVVPKYRVRVQLHPRAQRENHSQSGVAPLSPPAANTFTFGSASQEAPHDQFCTDAVEQYAARENWAGRWRSLVMSLCETAVGVPSVSSPEPMLMPKSGVGAARVRAARAASPRKERRMRAIEVYGSE